MQKPTNGDLVSGLGTRSDMTTVRETMRRLLETTDYKAKTCQEDLEFILKAIQAETSTSVTAEYKTTYVIIKAGLAQLFDNILSELSEPSGISIQHTRLIAACMCNATNRSEDICKQVIDMALPRRILKYMKNDKLDPTTNPKLMENDDIRICVINMMCVLHNVMKKVDGARKVYKEASATEILPRFRSVANPTMKALAIFVLAYITTDEENEKLNEDDENIGFIINMLREVYVPTKESGKHGFTTVGLLEGLNKLANNDGNKVRIIRKGALPMYKELLKIGNQKEQLLAVQDIRCLAFRCREFIIQEPGCVVALKTLASSNDKELKKNADGALWSLEEHRHREKDSTAARKHIMISYQWDNQQLMRRIGDELKKAGFKVWMDVYDMSGSTLEAMAAAVEEASMVLIAASTKYKDSVSCRTEGEYAYNKRREIVPVIVEPGYTPDGWLGPLVLNHLYFDFTDDTNFEQKMKELINEIQRRGQCMIQCNEGACTRKKIGSSADTTHSARGTASNSWAYSLCCCWPCHRRVLPEEQERKAGEPMRTIYVSGCFPMVDVKF